MKLKGLVFSGILLLLSLISLGCSEGEDIPLFPVGATCERPLDQGWQTFQGLFTGVTVRQVLWPQGRPPVVVGSSGLIVEYDENDGWQDQSIGGTGSLTTLAANDQGHVLAAGENGRVALSPAPGQWSATVVSGASRWVAADSWGGQFYLVNQDGDVATLPAGGQWEHIPGPPGLSPSSIFATADSLFVGGSNVSDYFTELWVFAEGHWASMDIPSEMFQRITALGQLPDGTMVALNSRLQIRGAEGWVIPEGLEDQYLNERMLIDGSVLWIGGDDLIKVDTEAAQWTVEEFPSGAYSGQWGIGPQEQVLRVTSYGRIFWQTRRPDESIESEQDPLGNLGFYKLHRFLDGTVVSPSWNSLFEVTAQGPELVSLDFEGTYLEIEPGTPMAGRSLQDFYFYRNWALWHFEGNGQLSEVEFPGLDSSVRDIMFTEDGQIVLTSYSGTLHFDGTQWNRVLTDWISELYMTGEGTVVLAMSGSRLAYISGTNLVPFEVDHSVRAVFEPRPGVLCLLASDMVGTWWEMGTGIRQTVAMSAMPDCPNLRIETGQSTMIGDLVCTEDFSIVMRLTGNQVQSQWELVAGPVMHQIEELQVLLDGSLVAMGDDRGTILIYPNPLF